MTGFIKLTAALAASMAVSAGAAQAQSAAQDASAHANQTMAVEQIYLLLDASQNRFEHRVLAKAEAGVAARTAKIQNYFTDMGAGSSSLRVAALQSFQDCIL